MFLFSIPQIRRRNLKKILKGKIMVEKVEWSLDYITGILVVDNQHRELFTYYNSLVDAIQQKNRRATMELLNKLEHDIIQHFAYEERTIMVLMHDNLEEHLQEHSNFKQELEEVKKLFTNTSFTHASEKIGALLEHWLTHHIPEIDMKYREALLE